MCLIVQHALITQAMEVLVVVFVKPNILFIKVNVFLVLLPILIALHVIKMQIINVMFVPRATRLPLGNVMWL